LRACQFNWHALNRVTPAPRVRNTQNKRKGVGIYRGKVVGG